MHVTITARHIQLSDALKQHTEDRLGKLEQMLNSSLSANVVLSVEKYRQSADISLTGKGFNFHGQDVTDDMYVAIDNAVEKIRRQAEKHKIRIRPSRTRGELRAQNNRPAETETAGGEEAFSEEESLNLARLGEAPPVVKTSTVPFKPMSVEEATLQLIVQNQRFFVFRNSATDEVNVVYLIDDGRIGLISPDSS